MKKERRHDLQTNLLADYLGKKLEQIKPYTNLIIGGVLLVALGVGVWKVIERYSGRDDEGAWKRYEDGTPTTYVRARILSLQGQSEETNKRIAELNQKIAAAQNDPARNAELASLTEQRDRLRRELGDQMERLITGLERDVKAVAKEFSDHPAGWTATLHLARESHRQGIQQLFSSTPGVGKDQLGIAIGHYLEVKKNASDPLLRQCASYGLARAYEARNDPDPKRQNEKLDDIRLAEAEYEQLARESVAFGDLAKRHLEVLRARENNFHKWFDHALTSKDPNPAGKAAGTTPEPGF